MPLREYDKAIRRNPGRALVFYNRGTAFLDLGQYQLAVNDYSEAIRVYPRDTEVYAARAFCYALMDEDAKAQQDVEAAVNLGFARAFLEKAIEEVKRQPQLLSRRRRTKVERREKC